MLARFGIKVEKISLLKYEALTPDSFIWFFNAGDESKRYEYCLYAEDFVTNLDHVIETMNSNSPVWDGEAKFALVKVLQPSKWDEASPVKGATVYQRPKKPVEFMKYATSDGYDFVFLGQSKEIIA